MINNYLFENYRKIKVYKKIIIKDKNLKAMINNLFKDIIEDVCYKEDKEKIFIFTDEKIDSIKRVNGHTKKNWKPIMIFITDNILNISDKEFLKDFSSIFIIILSEKNYIKIYKNNLIIQSREDNLEILFNKIKTFLISVIKPGEVRDYSQSKLKKIFKNNKKEKIYFIWGKVSFQGYIHCISNESINGAEGKIYFSEDNKWLFKIYKKNKSKDQVNRLKVLINDFQDTDDTFNFPINIVKDSSGCIGVQVIKLNEDYKNLSEYCGSIHKYVENHFSYKTYIDIAIKINKSIDKIHRTGYKHGDIHFNNIMFNNRNKKITLIDLDSIVKKDEYLSSKGIWGFKAPENVAGEGMSIFSDYYSLGILMGYLLLFRNVMQSTVVYNSQNQLEDYTISYGKEAKFTELNEESCKLLKIWFPIYNGGQLSYKILPLEIRVLIERIFILNLNISINRPKPKEWINALNIAKEKLIECKECKNEIFNNNKICPFCGIENKGWINMRIIEGQYKAIDYNLEYFKLDNMPSAIIDMINIFNKNKLNFIIRGGISLALNGVKNRYVSDIDIVFKIRDEINLLKALEEIKFDIAYREITVFNEIRYTIFWKEINYIKAEIIVTDKYIPSIDIKAGFSDNALKIATVDYLIYTKIYKIVNILNEHKVSKKNPIHAKEIIDLIPYVKNTQYIVNTLNNKEIDIDEFKKLAIDKIGKYLNNAERYILKVFLDGVN